MVESNRKPFFKLQTRGCQYDHFALSTAFFEEFLNRLTPDYWNFMTLKPDIPIRGSIFIKVDSQDSKNDNKLKAEIGIYNPNRIEMYQYCTESKAEVLQIFADYFERK